MIKVAVLGCGTVGSGVCRLLKQNRLDIAKRAGEEIEVKWVLDRVKEPAMQLGFAPEQITSDLDVILNDPEVKIVVELIGGTTIAFDFIMRAIDADKNIVTANKDLIAVKGQEIFDNAKAHGVDVCFEASVGGAIPVIGAMQQILCANKFIEIMGILNGTTNYILTKMASEGLSYAEALAEAQRLGYAEANPASDVEGTDAARKVAILGCLAFNSRCTLADVYCEGITDIDAQDIALAKSMGYAIKLLGVAREQEGKIMLFVRPAFVPHSHPLASVNDSFNAVFLRCDAADDIMLYGRGAGSLPTASSVVGNIMEIAEDIRLGVTGRHGCGCYTKKELLPVDALESSFFVRLHVSDKPNVLAGVASAFGEAGVSIASLIQSPNESESASLTIITHPAKESALHEALEVLRNKEYVSRIHTFLCLGTGDEVAQ